MENRANFYQMQSSKLSIYTCASCILQVVTSRVGPMLLRIQLRCRRKSLFNQTLRWICTWVLSRWDRSRRPCA